MTPPKTLSKPSDPHLETICRLCLLPNSGSINIFQSQLSIPVRIMACAALEVRTGDGLPSLICEKCRYQLEVSYYFRKKCQISDGKLRKHIRLLNAGRKSRVFVQSNDDDDDQDEEELQCEESIKFIEAIDAQKKADEDKKNQKWLEEQREQMRQENTQRLYEEFGAFMQARSSMSKTSKQENIPATSLSTQPLKHVFKKERESQKVQITQFKIPTLAQRQQEQQQEEQLQPEEDADNEITSSEQITEEQEIDQEQPQEQDHIFYSDDNGDEDNTDVLIFDGTNNDGEDDQGEQMINLNDYENEAEAEAEVEDNMCNEEEIVAEDASDENEMEGKHSNETEEMDEFIFLTNFDHSIQDEGQSEQICEVESYQIEENGSIQYLKDERSHDDYETHSNQHENSSDAKYIKEDIEIVNAQEKSKKLEKKKKIKKEQMPNMKKVVTLVREKLTSEDLRIFKCSECPQSFTRANSLLRHRSAHKGGREYCCDYCEKYFSCKSSLDRHIRIHTGEKPYTCDQCGKNFMQKEILKRHVTIHTGNRPHQCPHCPRSFVQKLLMNQHINAVHLAVPQITKNECHLCPKSFLHPSGLSRHLLTHKGMLFTCPECGRMFNDKSSLRRHFSAVHLKKEQNTMKADLQPDENESSSEFLMIKTENSQTRLYINA